MVRQLLLPLRQHHHRAGHSALLSGATLDKTGIIGNDWYDRKSAASVYCAGSDRYEFVPNPKGAPKAKSVGNPDKMMAEPSPTC